MTHARNQIRDAFVTALGTIPGLSVYNGRVFPLYDTTLPAVSVSSREETIDDEQGKKFGEQFRTLLLSVQCYDKVDELIDNSLDTISESVETAVFDDAGIKAIVRCLDLAGTEIEVSQEGEKPMGIATLAFSCKYITKEGEPGVILP